MTFDFFIINACIIIGSIFLSTALLDFFMNILQRKSDPWRIPLSSNQVLFQLVGLLISGILGYVGGYFIGSSLPFSQPSESFIIGMLFSFISSLIVRGYTMLYFHKQRSQIY